MVSSKTNEWETPQWFFDELNKEFGFTLDPCSNGNHKCDKFFTIKEDGLKQDWSKDIYWHMTTDILMAGNSRKKMKSIGLMLR